MTRESVNEPPRTQLQTLESDADVHDHVGLLYESRDERLAVVVPFVERGLESGERVVYARSVTERDELLARLREADVDVDGAIDDGALSIVDAEDFYIEDGEFDRERLFDRLEAAIADARADGFEGLRITAEITGEFLDGVDTIDPEEFARYDACVNHLFEDHDDVSGLCQYDRAALPESVADAAVRVHPVLAHRETIGRNTFYCDPEEFTPGGDVSVEPKLEAHRRRVRKERSLERRTRAIQVVAEATRELADADRSSIPRIAADAMYRAVDCEAAGLWLNDDESDELSLRAAAGAVRDPEALLERSSDLVRESFRTNERRREQCCSFEPQHGPGDADGDRSASRVRAAHCYPIAGSGVVVAVTSNTGGLPDPEARTARTVANAVRLGFGRVGVEHRLEAQSDRLDRVENVASVLRAMLREPVGASTREAVEGAVCDALLEHDDVAFAWMGTASRPGVATPRAWAGADRGYLADVVDDPEVRDPVTEPATDGRPAVVADVAEHVGQDEWRSETLARGFRSVAVVPVEHEGVQYGVLGVYAASSGVIDEDHGSILSELGTLVGHLLSTVEREVALRSESTNELEITVEATQFPFSQLARAVGAPLDVEDVVVTGNRELVVACSVREECDSAAVASESSHAGDRDRSDLDGGSGRPGGPPPTEATDTGTPDAGTESSGPEHDRADGDDATSETRDPAGTPSEPDRRETPAAGAGPSDGESDPDAGDRPDDPIDVDDLGSASSATAVESVDVVCETPDTHVLEVELSREFVGVSLSTHGATVDAIRATPTEARLIVQQPSTVEARTIVETIQERYDDIQLVARRTAPDPTSAPVGLRNAIEAELTDRQREVATVAYHAGYFEVPRRTSGEEVADALGISSQAFYQHVRRIQRSLFGSAFGDS